MSTIKRIDSLIIYLALLGGFILVISACITIASIILRNLGFQQIMGDSEIQSLSNLISFFFFLPYSIRTGSNVSVTIVRFKKRFLLYIGKASKILWAVFLMVISISLCMGMYSFFIKEEVSTSLDIPLWVIFIPIILSLPLSFASCLLRKQH